ncbi:MAG: hypothetical protein ACM3VT_07545 [Solirubrobacterales bacterium]
MTDRDPHDDTLARMNDLVTNLHRLLEQQVVCARAGSFHQIEGMAEAAEALVVRIFQAGDRGTAALAARRNDLKRLYGELSLILRAEHADVHGKLKQLRQVKKVVGVYAGATRIRSDHRR